MSKEPKENTGKPHEPTENNRVRVFDLASFGIPQEEIAIRLDMTAKTLRKHYRVELDKGKAEANDRVRRFLYEAASGMALNSNKGATFRDCITAGIFWGKTQMQMTEKTVVENYNNDGPAPKNDELETLSDDELNAIIAQAGRESANEEEDDCSESS